MEAISQVAHSESVLEKQNLLEIQEWCLPLVQDLRVDAQVLVHCNMLDKCKNY